MRKVVAVRIKLAKRLSLGRMTDDLVRIQVGWTFLADEKVRRFLVTRTRKIGLLGSINGSKEGI